MGFLNFFCIWMSCIAWTLKEVTWMYHFLLCWYTMLHFFTALSCGLRLCLFYLISLHFRYYNWTNISPPFVISYIKTNSLTKLPVMSSCHQFAHNRGEKKHLSFSIATKTVIQNYKPYNFLQNIFHNIHGRWRCKKHSSVYCHL